jgi:hypothetical protein
LKIKDINVTPYVALGHHGKETTNIYFKIKQVYQAMTWYYIGPNHFARGWKKTYIEPTFCIVYNWSISLSPGNTG